MGFLTLLLLLTSLASFVGYIWLVRNAFQSSTLWGLAVLFLSPFSAVLYAIKNWEDSKKPFLVYGGSTVGGLIVMVMMFSTMGGFQAIALANDVRSGEITEEQATDFINGQMDRIEASGMLSAQEQSDLERMRGVMKQLTEDEAVDDASVDSVEDADTAGEASLQRVSEPPEIADLVVVRALRVRAEETAGQDRHAPGGPIRVKDAGRYTGRTVTAVGTDGLEHTGRLTSADGDSLWFEQYFSGGTFAVELKKSQIRSLDVLEK